jgi:hypothetical protein
MDANPLLRAGIVMTALALGAMLIAAFGLVALTLLSASNGAGICGSPLTVGATEYGGPGDPSSGTVGSSGVSLVKEPDSYAELGGTTFKTATALGGLAYETPLAISWRSESVIAYKRDIGLGGGPIDGFPRAIDLWWALARSLGIPYEHGRWSGTVQIAVVSPACGAGGADAAQTAAGPRAMLLSDDEAAAPAAAPAAVRAIIAAGNQIVGKPYLYGGGHDLPLNQIAPAYDCSSSVAHLLWGGGLLPADGDMTSSEFEHWGLPGPGRWVTIYASAAHVFMYVAGLRWDTHNAAGSDDGLPGIGWHPLVREHAGFVVRHPPGL